MDEKIFWEEVINEYRKDHKNFGSGNKKVKVKIYASVSKLKSSRL